MFSFFKKKITDGYENLKSFFTKKISNTNETKEIENFLIENNFSKKIIIKFFEKINEKQNCNKIEEIKIIIKNIFSNINHKIENKKEVFLFVGVNGSGKTTNLIKLARNFKNLKENPCVIPADTFRAAAKEQLEFLCKNENIDFFYNENIKNDPSTIIYSGISNFYKNHEKILIDTSGRIHKDESLLRELKKIHKISLQKSTEHGFLLKTIIVLDAMQGQVINSQIEEFSSIFNIDGIILTKLDSGIKPGNIISIIDDYKIPILYLAYGEYKTDLIKFDIEKFLNLIFGENINVENNN